MSRHEVARRRPSALAEDDTDRARRFREASGQFATGVTVVSTIAGGIPHAMTVNSFTSVSIDPVLILVSLRNEAWTWRQVRRSGVFAVTVLGAHQEDEARWFADSARCAGAGAFAGIDWHPAPVTGAPVLADGIGYFDCDVRAIHPAGDHTLVVGEVRAFDVLSDRPPLLFVRSRFRS